MNTHEKLAFATTQVVITAKGGVARSGTGFFVRMAKTSGEDELILVTNKHVIENALKINLVISIRDAGAKFPRRTQTIDMIGQKWIFHPDGDVDLCCLKLSKLRAYVEGKDGVQWFIEPFEMKQIVSMADMEKYFPADEVFMIGYPDGLKDRVNNQPMFRRGVLAVIPSLNFNGKEHFVVDMAVYPGSSGSPIVSIDHGIHADEKGEAFVFMDHEGDARVLGVVFSTFLHREDGTIAVVPAETVLKARTAMPNSLGTAVKAYKILDFLKLI